MGVYEDIMQERWRQMTKGFDTAHDDEHTDGQIAAAAACYANPMMLIPISKGTNTQPTSLLSAGSGLPLGWPWEPGWWRPDSRRENLVKAAALLVAEIERLDRLTTPTS